ncbi:hypothetical protein ABPG73_004436 [Tetrahymena malaccensis]
MVELLTTDQKVAEKNYKFSSWGDGSMVELLTTDQKVAGSSPAHLVNFFHFLSLALNTSKIQAEQYCIRGDGSMVELLTTDQKVAGSSPAHLVIFFLPRCFLASDYGSEGCRFESCSPLSPFTQQLLQNQMVNSCTRGDGSMVELLTTDQKVAGSSPAHLEIFFKKKINFLDQKKDLLTEQMKEELRYQFIMEIVFVYLLK